MALGCALDQHDLRAQLERYRTAGEGASVIARTRRQLTVELDARVDAQLVDELLATERACCPFFSLTWQPETRRMTFSVAASADEPALDGIAVALGVRRSPRP
jgi:hypothetical protein